MNPGSVSIPKDGTPRSYMLFDGQEYFWKKLDDGSIYMRKPCK
jgi:predicted phosphodiesterase